MNTQELFKEALNMPPKEKALLIDGLLTSLDKPDLSLDSIWETEIEKRVAAYKSGKLKTVPYTGFKLS
ncbi:addiction module protein [Thiospirochaeta perfilievii]|uniref:Addiction module protein n=1 Tax=Thiospirochaeta perfilievii TaxID=252967 RepID=A0A5C1Q5Y8_9SPIO|nr:addiction module protein [Thiospirochaeta perfilievii]QEN03385.1 addiction module protein [Thiospirochaeta perfilievii]